MDDIETSKFGECGDYPFVFQVYLITPEQIASWSTYMKLKRPKSYQPSWPQQHVAKLVLKVELEYLKKLEKLA